MSVSFSVLTTMKNEGAFLLEWLAHHKALGFDAFVICTNDCEDPTTDMVLRLQRMGLVRHHATTYRPTQSIQRRAFRQAMQYDEIRKADWVYVCDADEFLCSRVGDGSVQALVAAGSPEVEAIAVPWRCFGTNGQQDFREGPITRQFTMANATEGPRAPAYAFPKSLFRGSVMPRLRRIGVHLPVALPDLAEPIRLELPGGRLPTPGPSQLHVPADYTLAQVNHYQLRSRDSFLVKSARGKVNHTSSKMEFSYWARNDSNDVPCDLIRRYDAEVERWMAEFLADRRLSTLHHRAVRWHREKIAELHASPDFAGMVAQIEAHRARLAAGPADTPVLSE